MLVKPSYLFNSKKAHNKNMQATNNTAQCTVDPQPVIVAGNIHDMIKQEHGQPARNPMAGVSATDLQKEKNLVVY